MKNGEIEPPTSGFKYVDYIEIEIETEYDTPFTRCLQNKFIKPCILNFYSMFAFHLARKFVNFI